MDERVVLAALLLSVRCGAVALVTPPLASAQLPTRVRVAFVLMLSTAWALGLPPAAWPPVSPQSPWWVAVFHEAVIGLALGLGMAFAFAAFQVAGQLIDQQVGFGLGQLFDPVLRQRVPVLTQALTQLSVVTFFAVGGPQALLRGLSWSLEVMPLGHAPAWDRMADALVRQGAAVFSLGFAVVAPVVVCLLLLELGLGVVARSLPQANLLLLGLPVKVTAGLLVLAAWLPVSGPLVAQLHAAAFEAWRAGGR